MDRLEELGIFVRIVEEGSLVRAARRLRRSAPAVTRALAALEDRVGQRLVDRTTRRLAVTAAGVALLERARTLLRDYEEATSPTPETPVGGVLRITAPVQFGRRHIAPIVRACSRPVSGAPRRVAVERPEPRPDRGGHRRCPPHRGLAGVRPDGPACGRGRAALGREPGLCATQRHPRHAGRSVSPRGHSGRRPWRAGLDARRWAPGAPPPLSARFRVNDVETQVRAACEGRGIARLLSYQVEEELRNGSLLRLLREYEPPALPVHLVTKGRTLRSPATEAFLGLAVRILSALPVIHSIAEQPA